MTNLKTGTRVHYTGDMANHEGNGIIIKTETDRWGDHILVKFDDRRPDAHLSPLNFAEGPGQRFMTEAEQSRRREAGIARMQETMRAMREKRN